MHTVLIIDDEEKLRTLLTRIIGLEGFEVIGAGDCKTALRKLSQFEVDVVFCDVKLPDGNGVEFCRTIKEKYPFIELILLTAYGNIPDGIQAIRNGAFDYLTKGDDNNRIIPLLHRAVEKVELAKRVNTLEMQLGNKYSFDKIIGKSKVIHQAIDMARKVAGTDTTVLLTGETGTGKEVFAQSIHRASDRSNQPFVAINCSAFSKDLLESEMFGHKAGAFTGAIKERRGLFEQAHKGTIFLDEIGEMTLDLQAKLLRVLETGELIRLGDSKVTHVDVRIIAATHRDLEHEIKTGLFREDLYYRISVFRIVLPPLRERRSDIEELANHFIRGVAAKTKKQVSGMSNDYIELVKMNDWPGNIRELKNVIERSVILTDNNILTIDTLPTDFRKNGTSESTGKVLSAFDLASAEKLHIQKVYNHTNGNKTETARLLNIALTTLYRKLEEYGIS